MTRPSVILSVTVLSLVVSACGGATAASPAPVPAATGPAVALTITAKDIAYTEALFDAPAGRPLDVTFDNRDAGIPHNVVLKAGPAFATEIFKSDITTGVSTEQFAIPGLVPGVYQFMCAVHPNMVATLNVGG